MNVYQLVANIESIFTCVDGPPRAFFELPIPAEVHDPILSPVLRIIYQTVNVAMVGDEDTVGAALCTWADSKFHTLISKEQMEDRSTVLFWRHRPSLERFTDDKGRQSIRLYMRLVIPGVDLSSLHARGFGDEPAVHWL